ncbi:MAG: TRAP transporter large permease [Burkholderiaceae bacterium]
MTTALILAGLIALLLTGAPIFAALGLASLGVMLVFEGHVNSAADTVFAKLNNPQLTVIPMFAFMAHAMIRAKVVDELYNAAQTLVGHFRGGLGVATVLSSTVFAAISGSSVATALTIGSSSIPQMRRFGYPAPATYGVVAAGGTLGILIPPSGPMILYAIVTEASIGALFLAGVLPGLMMALIFAAWCVVDAARHPGIRRESWPGLAAALTAVRGSIWAVLMPPIVLGGIYAGIFTASEAAAVGCVYAVAVGALVYRNFGWRALWDTAVETVRTSAMLFMILAAAAMFGHAVTIIRLPAELIAFVTAQGLSATQFILAVMAVIFVLGMFLETIAIILITTPIVFPVMGTLGIDPIWYGVLLMINLELALITPPVGMNLFTIKGIADAPLIDVIRGSLPYVLLMMLGLAIVFMLPGLATWLPRIAGYGA